MEQVSLFSYRCANNNLVGQTADLHDIIGTFSDAFGKKQFFSCQNGDGYLDINQKLNALIMFDFIE